MNFHVITLFPEMFDSYLGESILARAIKEKKLKVSFINPRKFVTGKYKKVWPDGNVSQQIDERPYGGGPGMVMMAEPVIRAVESVLKKLDQKNKKLKAKSQKLKPLIINFVPSAKKFDTAYAKNSVKKYTDIILICGRYEGIDTRINKILKCEQVSVGDFVLTGGELPAMILIDCIARQIPGVLGNFDSREEARISSSEIYTRPEILIHKNKKYKVPKVLLLGNHKDIENWKQGKK
ncbi:tRNA (guanosine(37)-N1)-methyltransferase TrmD [Candidatus Nomurabacteria bacterium RIFCSPHIGHO2_02_FULL_38_15]|uniref:tRNA (guanine-N(1)-)-methyltransferase n=1 Tax=Candidatus Nomurabacteria bacterium RIFCSPHIGHO2_02_FULL_38_15 TaxID=1801752 RepID=A0A1F6VRQ1_9BACT|nr:MAG: tRNA (guanosine(37)-N1)-methyltransferase TrmD [Candidatus Nomurabacteria bacterium RIFCSPHIGHO2_02_FULL_38_15]